MWYLLHISSVFRVISIKSWTLGGFKDTDLGPTLLLFIVHVKGAVWIHLHANISDRTEHEQTGAAALSAQDEAAAETGGGASSSPVTRATSCSRQAANRQQGESGRVCPSLRFSAGTQSCLCSPGAGTVVLRTGQSYTCSSSSGLTSMWNPVQWSTKTPRVSCLLSSQVSALQKELRTIDDQLQALSSSERAQ